MGFAVDGLYLLDRPGGLGPSWDVSKFSPQPEKIVETSILNVLLLLAFGLLIAVTGGIGYLTTVEWRDRRRLEREKRSPKNSRLQKQKQ